MPGFEGGSGCTWGFRIEPRQIALIGTIRGVRHVIPDPIPPPIQPLAKMRLSGAPGGYELGAFFAGEDICGRLGLSFIQDAHSGFCVLAGFRPAEILYT